MFPAYLSPRNRVPRAHSPVQRAACSPLRTQPCLGTAGQMQVERRYQPPRSRNISQGLYSCCPSTCSNAFPLCASTNARQMSLHLSSVMSLRSQPHTLSLSAFHPSIHYSPGHPAQHPEPPPSPPCSPPVLMRLPAPEGIGQVLLYSGQGLLGTQEMFLEERLEGRQVGNLVGEISLLTHPHPITTFLIRDPALASTLRITLAPMKAPGERQNLGINILVPSPQASPGKAQGTWPRPPAGHPRKAAFPQQTHPTTPGLPQQTSAQLLGSEA